MERLTEKANELDIWEYKLKLQKNFRLDEYNGELTLYGETVNRLAYYEDAEKNGLLVRLPCKVGDILYKSGRGQISEHRVKTIRVEPFAIWIEWDIEKGIFLDRIDGVNANEIGKTVFLTQAEAEAKLKEMEGEYAK